MEIKLHNILVTVGPSMSGKSFWANKTQEYLKENYPELNVHIVASDDIRRNLLGEDLDRYHPKMGQVSNQAFNLLYSKIDALSSWPINAEIIIVDTTGLAEQFRKDILAIAHKNQYNSTAIVFNYKNNEDYFRFGGDKITRKHITRLRDVHRTLNRFDDKIEIKSPDDPIEIAIPDYDHYRTHFLPGSIKDYVVIGDLHGSWEALSHFDDVDPSKLIFIGDIIDKAPIEDIEQVLERVWEKGNAGAKFVIGNHEDWVYKYWQGSTSHNKDIAEKYFQTALNLSNSGMELLLDIVKNGKYFYRTYDAIVTHAPSRQEYLGKLHTTNKQKVYRYPRLKDYTNKKEYQEALYKAFDFLKEQEQWGYPLHIWGHVALDEAFKNICNLGIDTGAVYGNGLTYYHQGRYETIPTIRKGAGEVINIRRPKAKIGINQIDTKSKGRILWMAKNKVNFLSGTMSPSDKMGDDLESLQWALDYYKNEELVVVQPKYMGSRANVYLFNDPTKCYLVTRKGYLFKENETLYPEYQRLIERFQDDFNNGLVCRILDAEVLPWRLLGAGLIDKSFFGYGDVVKRQLENIQDLPINVWEEYFNQLQIDETSKADVIKEYGHHTWTTYLAYKNLKIDLNVSNVDKFLKQVDLYGQDGSAKIKPFTILKDVMVNEERLYNETSNQVLWELVNDDKCLLTKPDNYEEILKFWNNLTFEQGYEGVVVKPYMQSVGKDTAPYIKVRNPEYLRIVYGFDYTNSDKYNKLMRRKRINAKLRKSIQDWQSGWKLLEIPYNDLAEENQELIETYIQHVIEESKESKIDPRL